MFQNIPVLVWIFHGQSVSQVVVVCPHLSQWLITLLAAAESCNQVDLDSGEFWDGARPFLVMMWWYRSPKRRAGPFKCLSLRQKKGPTTRAVQSFNCKHSHARIKFIKEGEMRVPRTQQCPLIVITDSFISDTFAQVRIAPTEDQQQPPKSKKRKDQDREDNDRCHQWYGWWTITAEGTKFPQIGQQTGQQFLYLDSFPQRFQSSSFRNQCAVINLWNAIWH